ncbi:MAG: amino acid adenylation domain-containing protein [Bacteroidia bacterium]
MHRPLSFQEKATYSAPEFQPILAFWQQVLANIPPILPLAKSDVKRQTLVLEGLSYEQWKKITKLNPHSNFVLLLTHFEFLLHKCFYDTPAILLPMEKNVAKKFQAFFPFYHNEIAANYKENVLKIREQFLAYTKNAQFPIQLAFQQNTDYQTNIFSHCLCFSEELHEVEHQEMMGLSLQFAVEKEKVCLHFQYNPHFISDFQFEHFYRFFADSLMLFLANPAISIAEIHAQCMEIPPFTWETVSGNLVEHFEKSVIQFPHRPALSYQGNEISYEELNKLVNQFAQFIQKQSIENQRIAVICDRSPEMIAAFLGILKTGNCYVPIDNALPSQRVAYILKDAQVEMILGSEQEKNKLIDYKQFSSFEDVLSSRSTSPQNENISQSISPEQAAYIIYTSGTTGEPKGCMVSHKNVVNLFAATDFFKFTEQDIWVLAHSPSFDFSVWEIYGALLYGGKLILTEKETIQNTNLFLSLIFQEKVTILNQTPKAFHALSELENTYTEKYFSSIRYIIFGGDKLISSQLSTFANRYDLTKCALVNMYGITETTVHVSYHFVSKEDIFTSLSSQSIIGKSLPHLHIQLFDKNEFPQITGFEGEMYVRGEGLSLGYFNKKELTDKAFISYQNIYYYKSGDIAKTNISNQLAYIGRRDKQIKIRGYRVELGEIEQKIKQIFSFIDCIVLFEEKSQTLTAYYLGNSHFPKEELSKELPAYMLPTYWVQIEKVPLNQNGKLDITALPSPLKKNEENFTPKNAQEQLLYDVLKQILGVEKISSKDHFFSLGGDSIKAILVISALRKVGFELSLAEIFAAQNLIELSSKLRVIEKRENKAQKIDYKEVIEKNYPHFSIKKAYPLSSAQVGILLETLKNPDKNVYFEQFCYTLSGAFQAALLQESYALLLKEMPMLASFFAYDGLDFPLQILVENSENKVQFIENEDLEYILSQDRQRPFHLHQPQLIRLTVHQQKNQSSFIWSHHHILIDGWCISLIMKRFVEIYTQLENKKQISVSKVFEKTYENYLSWLFSQNKDKAKEYWATYLQKHETAALIPYQKTKIDFGNSSVERTSYSFDNQLIDQVKSFCQTHHLTLNSFFQTIWGIALQRYNHNLSVTFGTVFSGRSSEIENIDKAIGLFINVLPIVFEAEGEEKVLDILQKQQKQMLSHENNQFLSLPEIQQQNPKGDTLFHHLFVFENYHVQENILFSDYQLLAENYFEKTHYPFQLMLYPQSQGITAEIIYHSALYQEENLIQIFAHLSNLISQVIKNPFSNLSKISLISKKEKSVIFDNFNSPYELYKDDENIVFLMENAIQHFSHHIAIENEQEKFSFEEIDVYASKIYAYLLEKGLKKGDMIGLMIGRESDVLSVLLAIFRLGCVYVPIDEKYPQKRIDFIINNANCKYIITSNDLPFIRLQENSNNILVPKVEISQNDTAYLIYTSGSTGEPKAVEISHGNLYYFIKWALQEFQDTPFERMLAGTSFCFDLSIFELFFTFCAGKTLQLLNHNLEIPQYLHLPKLFINTVPSVLKRILTENLENVVAINSAGEALPFETVQELLRYPNLKLRNLYAPSETTTYSTCVTIQNTDNQITIGKPIHNTNVYLADIFGQAQAIGIAGEIIIGGKGVAKGYYQNKEITNLKFKNSLVGKSYFTGDFGCWNDKGEIIFIGRKDTQTKLRGYRIELGEIEQVLKQHSLVNDAVVLIEDGKLLAFFETNGSKDIDNQAIEKEIEAFLAQELPTFMLPNLLVALFQIPRTPNGKIDKSLLMKTLEDYATNQEKVNVTNEKEQILFTIWQIVLGISNIGTNENFFQLGGDSIKAMQMSSMLHQEGYKISLKDIFQFPNIQQLAERLERNFPILSPQIGQMKQVPLSPIQRWFFEHFEGNVHHFNQSVFLKTSMPLDFQAFQQAIRAVVQQHFIFRLRFAFDSIENNFIQKTDNLIAECFEIKEYNLQNNDTDFVQSIVEKHQTSLHIEKAKWLSIALFRESDNTNHLFITLHHLVIDGVSWRIFLQDLQNYYQQISINQDIDLQEVIPTFADWALFLESYAKTLQNTSIYSYWQPFLSQKNCYHLPKTYAESKFFEINLAPNLTHDLLYETYQAYQTEINDLLFAALEISIKKVNLMLENEDSFFKKDEIFINLEGHGREQLSSNLPLESAMGWFTSMFPVQLNIFDNSLDIKEIIIKNKEYMKAIPQKGIDYGIINELLVSKNAEKTFYSEISFNYLGQFDDNLGSTFSISPYSVGNAADRQAKRIFALDINALIVEKVFKISFSYDDGFFSTSEIQTLANFYIQALSDIILHCKAQQETQFTPSDFGANELSQDELSAIQGWISEIDL